MRNAKKALLLALCALLLVGASIMGTLAYLTSQATVTNTFTVGNVAITMDEAKVTAYGVQDGDARVTTNTYKLVPGHTYKKDPTIHVASNSEDCYLFVEITKGDNFTLIGLDGWTQITGTNVWYYNSTATANDNVVVFTDFTYSANVTGAVTPSEADLVIVAYAVQKDSFDTAQAAWAATFGQTRP